MNMNELSGFALLTAALLVIPVGAAEKPASRDTKGKTVESLFDEIMSGLPGEVRDQVDSVGRGPDAERDAHEAGGGGRSNRPDERARDDARAGAEEAADRTREAIEKLPPEVRDKVELLIREMKEKREQREIEFKEMRRGNKRNKQ